MIYHNPHALYPLDPNLFDDSVAQCFFDMESKLVRSIMPQIFPYASHTMNIKPTDSLNKNGE